eukprot:3552165-Prymnesium_polylepis.1
MERGRGRRPNVRFGCCAVLAGRKPPRSGSSRSLSAMSSRPGSAQPPPLSNRGKVTSRGQKGRANSPRRAASPRRAPGSSPPKGPASKLKGDGDKTSSPDKGAAAASSASASAPAPATANRNSGAEREELLGILDSRKVVDSRLDDLKAEKDDEKVLRASVHGGTDEWRRMRAFKTRLGEALQR